MPIAVTVPRWNTAASAHLALIEHMSIAVTAAHWNSDAAADVTFVERNAAIRNAIASNCFRLIAETTERSSDSRAPNTPPLLSSPPLPPQVC